MFFILFKLFICFPWSSGYFYNVIKAQSLHGGKKLLKINFYDDIVCIFETIVFFIFDCFFDSIFSIALSRSNPSITFMEKYPFQKFSYDHEKSVKIIFFNYL